MNEMDVTKLFQHYDLSVTGSFDRWKRSRNDLKKFFRAVAACETAYKSFFVPSKLAKRPKKVFSRSRECAKRPKKVFFMFRASARVSQKDFCSFREVKKPLTDSFTGCRSERYTRLAHWTGKLVKTYFLDQCSKLFAEEAVLATKPT